MFKFTAFCLTIFVVVGLSHCWVFNNVDYQELAAKHFFEDDDENAVDDDLSPQAKISLIFPGTKWCGAGDIADNYDDLGVAKKTDICCREHDNCPEVIPAGEAKYNLTNEAFYSRLSCDCDETFRLCLRKVNNKVSRIIGKTYFNALGAKCYRNDYPVVGCKEMGGWLNSKCVEYSYDTTGPKRYQWFDVPNF